MTAKTDVNDTPHKFSKNFTKVRKAIDDLPSDFLVSKVTGALKYLVRCSRCVRIKSDNVNHTNGRSRS